VVSGRCLPYGEGITFWAVSEMVVSAAGVDDADTPERAAELIERLVGDAVDAGRVGEQLASLVGIAQLPAETEPAWAVRRLFEILASRGPLVAFFDDLHWAEPGLLDVIEHVAELAREAPILLLCTARPELLETRPGWGGGMLHATAIQLEPLDDLESEELIANLLSHPALTPEIRQRIREAARGNPLFVEEMLSMLLDDGSIVQRNGGWEGTVDLSAIQVPPAISTLLAARLDRLSTEERSVLESASVVGEIFERDAVRALIGGSIEESLTGLIRKDLIVPGRSDLGAGDALRFRHVLIRDAAYAGMAKERRAAQHGAFGDWLAATVPERLAEYDEVLGYHYEQAYELLRELGVHEGVQAHADRASFHLARAGFRAQARDDAAATANLLFRAARLRPLDAQRVEMLIGSINAATEMLDTRTLTDASALAVADASELEDEALRLRVELAVGWARISNEREFFIDALRAVEAKAWEAVAILEPLDDRRGLAEAWRVLAWERGGRSQFAEGVEAARVAYQHAQASGDETAQIEALTMELGWMKWGPTSVTETARRCDELWERADRSRTLAAEILLTRAANEAMSGHVDAAEQAFSEGVATLEDLGRTLSVAFAAQTGWIVAVLAGDPAAAEARMAASIDLLIRHGRHSLQHLHQLMRAQAMCALGRIQEAEAIVREQRGQVSEDDLTLVPIVYRVLAQAASDRGDHEEADRASRKALEIGHMTDGVFDLAWTYLERGDILRAAADPSAADAAYREALQLAEGKGDVATAAYARARAG
jgi:predicted ATPase